jgi:hypothetical protein
LSKSTDPRFRRDDRDFSRGGPLSPELLVVMLLYMVGDGNRRGYRRLLEGFWDEARSHGMPLPTEVPISATSFCSARPKITSGLFKHVLQEIATTAFDDPSLSGLRWRGRRVFAVDGDKINLQRSPELDRAFGTPKGAYCPQVLLSVLFDVCAKMPVDAEVSSSATSEREHLLQMLQSLEPKDLLLLDRGYPSHEILQALCRDEIDFLIRLPEAETFAVVDRLRGTCLRDLVFTLDPPRGAPSDWKPLEIRVVKIKMDDGAESFFFTSLGVSEFDHDDLRELYHLRWVLEEFFKVFDGSYIGQGQFRSKSAEGVLQEIYALLVFLAISRLFMAAAAKASGVPYRELSQKAAVLALAANVTRILLPGDPDCLLAQFHALLQRIARARERPRPGRRFPRVSFKPGPRWGPTGRRGG